MNIRLVVSHLIATSNENQVPARRVPLREYPSTTRSIKDLKRILITLFK